MNRRDRELMNRLYKCAAKAADAYPFNPADVQRIAQAARTTTDTMKALSYILSSLSYADDYDIAVEEVGDLEATLGIASASPRTQASKERP